MSGAALRIPLDLKHAHLPCKQGQRIPHAFPITYLPCAVPRRPSVFQLLEKETKPMRRMLLDSIQVAASDVL